MEPTAEKIFDAYTLFERPEKDLLRDLVVFLSHFMPTTYSSMHKRNKTLRCTDILAEISHAHRKLFICSQFFLWNGSKIQKFLK